MFNEFMLSSQNVPCEVFRSLSLNSNSEYEIGETIIILINESQYNLKHFVSNKLNSFQCQMNITKECNCEL